MPARPHVRRTLPTWTVGLAVLVGGCAGPEVSPPTGTPPPAPAPTPTAAASTPLATATPPATSASPSPDDAAQVVELHVSEDPDAPRRVEVAAGTTVRLRVSSDIDDELHVHGYEVGIPLRAGSTTERDIRADRPGLFEVESHGTGAPLLQLVVR